MEQFGGKKLMKITPESTKKRRSAKNYAKNYARYLKKSPTTKISDNKKKINVELQKNHKKKSKNVIGSREEALRQTTMSMLQGAADQKKKSVPDRAAPAPARAAPARAAPAPARAAPARAAPAPTPRAAPTHSPIPAPSPAPTRRAAPAPLNSPAPAPSKKKLNKSKKSTKRHTKRNNSRQVKVSKPTVLTDEHIKRVEKKIQNIRKQKLSDMKKELEKRGVKTTGKSNRLLKDIYLYSKMSKINFQHEK